MPPKRGTKVKSVEPVVAAAPPPPKKRPLHASFLSIFNAVRNTVATHPKLCLQLIKIYQKSDFDMFFGEFLDFLKFSLVIEEKHPQVERTIAFVATFTTANKKPKAEKEKKEGEEDSAADNDDVSQEKEGYESTEDNEEEEEDIDPFLINMFQFLLNNHEANSNAVRYRVCQLINKILNNMGESAFLDDDLFSTIYDTMLQRLMDKKPAVRVQAILALNRLQDPRNKECPVIKAYRYHLSMDPSSDVRRAALLSVAITFQTLPDVLQRTRDKNYLVRRQAYLVIAQKVHIRSLQIRQRVRLLSEGLNDRNESVRTAVQKNLLQAWLRFVNGSVLDLLTCLDVETSTKGAELALDTLYIDVPAATLVNNFGLLDENKMIPIEKLKPESALYWKSLVNHLRKENADTELDHLMPDLSAFCDYIRAFVMSEGLEEEDDQVLAVRQMENEFVLQQLLLITHSYDLADEVGRKSLDKLIRSLLVSDKVGDTSIVHLVDVFARLYPPNSRVHQLAEIISDVREPAAPAVEVLQTPLGCAEGSRSAITTPLGVQVNAGISEDEHRANKVKAAKVRVELNQVREELEECVRSLDLDRAQELKLRLRTLEENLETVQQLIVTPRQTPAVVTSEERVDEVSPVRETQQEEEQQEPQEKDDPQTLARCLTIVCQMLKSVEISSMNSTLYSLHDNLLLPCLKNQDPLVRKLAVQALSLLCLISKELTQKHLLLFVQISQIDIETIQVLALNAVFDLLLLYGVDEFNSAASQDCMPQLATDAGVEEDTQDAANTIISILSKHLDSEQSEVRTAVAMGLCKLLHAARITSPKLLSHLVLLWYNPVTVDDNMLRHMLGVFFPLYSAYGGSNQECVASAVLPTIRTLVDAPARSPLNEVDIDDVANFMISITSPAMISRKSAQLINLHDSLVFSICSDILAFPDTLLSKHLVRMLRHLTLTATNYTNLRQILVLTEKMTNKLREKPLLNAIEKFQATIKGYIKLAPVKEEPEEVPAEVASEQQQQSMLADSMTTDMTVMGDKTVDLTLKRKRRLYCSTADSEMLSSEAESEIGCATPKKKINATFKEEIDDDDDVVTQTIVTGSDDQTKEENPSSKANIVEDIKDDEELELRTNIGRNENDVQETEEQNLCASPELPQRNNKQKSPKLVVRVTKLKQQAEPSASEDESPNESSVDDTEDDEPINSSVHEASSTEEEEHPSPPKRSTGRPRRPARQSPTSGSSSLAGSSPPRMKRSNRLAGSAKVAPTTLPRSRATAASLSSPALPSGDGGTTSSSPVQETRRGVRRNSRGKPKTATPRNSVTTSSSGNSSPEGRPAPKRTRGMSSLASPSVETSSSSAAAPASTRRSASTRVAASVTPSSTRQFTSTRAAAGTPTSTTSSSPATSARSSTRSRAPPASSMSQLRSSRRTASSSVSASRTSSRQSTDSTSSPALSTRSTRKK